MLNLILLAILLCTTPAIPYGTYQDRQAVHCKAQNPYLLCYDTPGYSSTFYLPDAVDISEEGYDCFFVSRNYDNYTNSYACFNQPDINHDGILTDGWIVRDYQEGVTP